VLTFGVPTFIVSRSLGVAMRRREFITFLGGAATTWPLAARAQQPAMPVIGFLGTGTPTTGAPFVAAFRQGLTEAGFEDGRNVAIEFRWAGGQGSRLPALAADLAGRQASVIVSSSGIVAARAAKGASASIPIVFVMGGDPVKFGLVASFNRPGGNLTGVSFLLNVLAAKRVGLLRELVPTTTTIGLLVNPDNANAEADTKDAQTAAHTLGQQTRVVHVRTESDFDAAFASLVKQRAAALFVASDVLFLSQRDRLVALATSHALPAIYDRREFPAAGGLISYGTNFPEAHRQAGIYAGRILKGEKAADLPVAQATKFELVINLKTAKVLGVKISDNVLSLADEVIE
jgi:putative ABC transport system substrate-binding protein